MATLAALLKRRGHDVRGSDQNVYPPMSDFLQQQGIVTLQGYRPEHIGADLDMVVVGNAISRGNPELEEVLDRKIRYCSLPEAIRDNFLWGARSIVIAGTHGKTTTTSIAGWLLTHGGADPSVLIGGIAENFDSSYRVGGGRDFVIEGDEYDSAFFDKTAKFLKYLPDIAVISNIEFDHADIYPDLDAIRLAFQRFVNLVPRRGLVLLGADNADALALRARAHCTV
jgi:UDP-N-acetylmuramate: L-alanyl-gamma-D-glutamyl-meso-diaminopimelate ligase